MDSKAPLKLNTRQTKAEQFFQNLGGIMIAQPGVETSVETQDTKKRLVCRWIMEDGRLISRWIAE